MSLLLAAFDWYYTMGDGVADPVADCLVSYGFTGIQGDAVSRIAAPREWIEWCTDSALGVWI